MSNSIVAVSIVVIALSLVTIDLRENLFKKTFSLSILLLGLGVCATLINLNPLLGLVINLVVIFFIVYQGCNTYKENIYFPFLLAYIFMGLSAPAELQALPLRMLAIFVGCIYILLIQLVLNKGRFHKTIFHSKKQLLTMTIAQVDCLLIGSGKTNTVQAIYPLTRAMVKAIYDTRLHGKVLSHTNKGKLLFVLAIENLYKALGAFDQVTSSNDCDHVFLGELKTLLVTLDDYFYGSSSTQPTKDSLLLALGNFKHYAQEDAYRPIVESLYSLEEALTLMETAGPTTASTFFTFKTMMKPLDPQSMTFKFAIKVALSVSVLIFLTDWFDLTYGRWMIFPIIAIIQPYMDGTRKKALERVLGTFLGIILFVVIFTLVQDNMVRLNITIFLAYINLFMKKYYIYTSLIAVSALGSVAMGGAGPEILTLRVFFTVFGCVLGLLVNRYFFPHTLDVYTEELIKEYKHYRNILKLTAWDATTDSQKWDYILKIKLLEYRISQTLVR